MRGRGKEGGGKREEERGRRRGVREIESKRGK